MRRSVNGADLQVQDEGKGAEAILLLHGLGTSLGVWDDLAPLLAGRFRVVRFDLRGLGGSSGPEMPPYSLGLWARDAKVLLDQLELQRAVVVSHGYGAAVALEMALDFPMATRGMVAVSPLLRVPAGVAAGARQQMETAERQGMAAVIPLVQQQIAPVGSGATGVFDRLRPSLQATEPASYARTARAMMRADLSDRIEDVAKPTLVVVGQHDPLATVALARELEETISGARIQILPGVSHLLPLEAPQELARLITDFATNQVGRF
jgi:pimeloyl-ACP methyl ester carboxylesterase